MVVYLCSGQNFLIVANRSTVVEIQIVPSQKIILELKQIIYLCINWMCQITRAEQEIHL